MCLSCSHNKDCEFCPQPKPVLSQQQRGGRATPQTARQMSSRWAPCCHCSWRAGERSPGTVMAAATARWVHTGVTNLVVEITDAFSWRHSGDFLARDEISESFQIMLFYQRFQPLVHKKERKNKSLARKKTTKRDLPPQKNVQRWMFSLSQKEKKRKDKHLWRYVWGSHTQAAADHAFICSVLLTRLPLLLSTVNTSEASSCSVPAICKLFHT